MKLFGLKASKNFTFINAFLTMEINLPSDADLSDSEKIIRKMKMFKLFGKPSMDDNDKLCELKKWQIDQKLF